MVIFVTFVNCTDRIIIVVVVVIFVVVVFGIDGDIRDEPRRVLEFSVYSWIDKESDKQVWQSERERERERGRERERERERQISVSLLAKVAQRRDSLRPIVRKKITQRVFLKKSFIKKGKTKKTYFLPPFFILGMVATFSSMLFCLL